MPAPTPMRIIGRMPQAEIQGWLTYWQNANMVNVDAIRAFDQVHLARKYCSCMREGVFADVSDLDIWRALENMRSGKYPPAPTPMRIIGRLDPPAFCARPYAHVIARGIAYEETGAEDWSELETSYGGGGYRIDREKLAALIAAAIQAERDAQRAGLTVLAVLPSEAEVEAAARVCPVFRHLVPR